LKDLLPYRSLSPDVIAALGALEAADRFEGLEASYRIVSQEAQKRIPLFLAQSLPAFALGAALVFAAQRFGWLPDEAPWAYAFGPILFLALVMSQLRPQAMRDDMRIGNALKKWRKQAAASIK
jgi:hypothetical protein